jgi:predicted AAA+ superfamily ATPase
VLLTGARGTGKSSLIKACLNEFAPQGLRLIEVDKADLVDLPDLVDLVAERPERFIVFCDDLSFDEGEPGYKALKSVLDGSVAQASDNLLIYATSNRRHLLPEYMKENLSYQHTEDGEVHPGEVVEEKISLSERFGLWLSFYPFTQAEYLAIVAQWLRSFGVTEDRHRRGAARGLVWALERGSRSGRVASSSRATMPGGTTLSEPTVVDGGGGTDARPGGRGGGRADRRRRPLPADQPPAGQGLRRATGNSPAARSSPARPSSRRCGASCTKNSASPSARRSPGRWRCSTTRMPWCACTSARCTPGKVNSRCARARPWPGRTCRCRCSRCCRARCRCCAGCFGGNAKTLAGPGAQVHLLAALAAETGARGLAGLNRLQP